MQNLRIRKTYLLPPILVLTLGLAVVGCGGGGGSSGSTPSTNPSGPASTPASSGEPTTGSAAQAAITANFVAFFDAKTPVARRIALLQNGSQFASVIRAQAGSPLALLASAKVNSVTLNGTTTAGVVYTILAGGKTALPNQQGQAVYQGGVWKVSDTVFCGLLKLENGGKTSGLPAGCQG